MAKNASNWQKHGLSYRLVKRPITARVDAEVLEWLRAGKRYQCGMKAIFAAGMLAAVKGKVGGHCRERLTPIFTDWPNQGR